MKLVPRKLANSGYDTRYRFMYQVLTETGNMVLGEVYQLQDFKWSWLRHPSLIGDPPRHSLKHYDTLAETFEAFTNEQFIERL